MCLELIAREQKSQVGKPTGFLNLARNHFLEIILRSTFAKDAFPDIWHCGDSWYGGLWMGTHHAGENTNISEYFKGEVISWVFVAFRGLCAQCGVPCSKQLSYQVSCPPLWVKIDNVDNSCGIAISNPVAWSKYTILPSICRFREIHIINESYMFDIIYALVRPCPKISLDSIKGQLWKLVLRWSRFSRRK